MYLNHYKLLHYSSHKKSCDLNWKKKRVFQRKGKVGGYFVPQKKKAELKRKGF